jgi:hypothetical protein
MEQPPRRPILRRRAPAALAAALVLGGAAVLAVVLIDGGDKRKPPAVSGTPAEAVAVVTAFQRALAARDFATICDSLYSRRARAAAGGDNCQSVLAQATARIPSPRVQIRSVVLGRGGAATVGVVAATATERPSPDVIRLVRQRGRFRIASAGNPVRSRE